MKKPMKKPASKSYKPMAEKPAKKMPPKAPAKKAAPKKATPAKKSSKAGGMMPMPKKRIY